MTVFAPSAVCAREKFVQIALIRQCAWVCIATYLFVTIAAIAVTNTLNVLFARVVCNNVQLASNFCVQNAISVAPPATNHFALTTLHHAKVVTIVSARSAYHGKHCVITKNGSLIMCSLSSTVHFLLLPAFGHRFNRLIYQSLKPHCSRSSLLSFFCRRNENSMSLRTGYSLQCTLAQTISPGSSMPMQA